MVTSAADDKFVRVWSSEDGTLMAVLKGHTDGVNGLALFGPGLILSSGEDGMILQWNLASVFEGVLASAESAGNLTPKRSGGPLLSKARSQSIFGKPRASSDAKPKQSRSSVLRVSKPRSQSDAMGGSSNASEVTPGVIANFRAGMTPLVKMQKKMGGQYYPSCFTGKDMVAWIKQNIPGCDSSKAALQFGAKLAAEGAFELVNGKGLSDASSCILKLK